MPRKAEPSFRLKQIIWDLAATTGAENLAALVRDLDYALERLRKNKDEDFAEDMPDVRTVRRIIELDINRLLPEVVVSKLPPHVWHLRHDYEKINELAERMKTKREVSVETRIEQGRKWIISKDAIHKEKIEEVRREKAKSSSEQVPSQVASGQPGRRRLTLDAPVVDGCREKHGPRKKRHLVKAVDPRMTWCGHSLDGRIHLFWTNKIELCTCWHCRRWYNYAASGLLDSDLQKHGGTA